MAVVFTPKSRAAEAGEGGIGEDGIGVGGSSNVGGAPDGIGSNPESD